MTIHLPPADLRALSEFADGFVENLFRERPQSVVKHAAPFSKRNEGRRRRTTRRQAIARKRSFLD